MIAICKLYKAVSSLSGIAYLPCKQFSKPNGNRHKIEFEYCRRLNSFTVLTVSTAGRPSAYAFWPFVDLGTTTEMRLETRARVR